MKKMARWFRKNIPKWMPDLLAFAGAAAIGRGAFLIWVPAGWIAVGVLLLAAAVIWSKGMNVHDL